MVTYFPLSLNAFIMKSSLKVEWTFEPPLCFYVECWWQRKPSRTTLNQKVSLVKAGKTQYVEHLQVGLLIRGIDSKEQINKHGAFLPSPYPSAVWCMSGPAVHQPSLLDGKLGISPCRRQRTLSLSICMDKHVHEHVCFWESVHVGMCFLTKSQTVQCTVYMLGCIYL